MSKEKRIAGRVNGEAYEIVQAGRIIQTMPLADARADKKLRRAIQRNNWEAP